MKAKQLLCLSLGLATLTVNAASFDAAYERLGLEDPEFLAWVNMEQDFFAAGQWLTRLHQNVIQANPQLPPIPVNYTNLFREMGLVDLEGVMMASERAVGPEGFVNQTLIEFGDKPKGLFTMFGSENFAFDVAGRVPAGTDAVSVVQLRPDALVTMVRQIAIGIMGPAGQSIIDQQLQRPLGPDGPSIGQLLNMLSTRITSISNVDTADVAAEAPFTLQELSGDIVYIVEGAADLPAQVAGLLPLQLRLRPVEGDPYDAMQLQFEMAPGMEQSFLMHAVPGTDDLMIANGAQARDWFLSDSSGVTDHPEFKMMAAEMPQEGIYHTWTSAKASAHAITVVEQQLATVGLPPQAQPIVDQVMGLLGTLTGPTMSTGVMGETEMHFVTLAPYSQKTTLALFGAVVPGVGAAMAIPAFQKVQQTSQEKAVTNNLRQLAAAAQQYMLETGESSVTTEQLVGEAKYISTLPSVAGESYEGMIITSETTQLSVTLPDGRTVTYSF
ncbi:MAG: hypothetical protein GVY10_03100 [Verrucomicrobia bacterium]|nr:hypothetical protein [Verrucomicrobiota bacterium]